MLSVYPITIPYLLVGIFCALITWLGVAVKFTTDADNAMMRAFRMITLSNAITLGCGFFVFNGWLPNEWATRVLLGAFGIMIPVCAMTLRNMTRRRTMPIEWLSYAASILCTILLFVQPTWFIGHWHATKPWLYIAPIAGQWYGAMLVIYATTFLVPAFMAVRKLPDGFSNHAKMFGLALGLIALSLSFDGIVMVLHQNFVLLGWVGSLAGNLLFSRLIINHYNHTFHHMQKMQKQQQNLREQVARDALTGLHSRSFATSALERLLKEGTACVIFIDLDDFKSWNDDFSHAVGDEVLMGVADAIRASVRLSDIAARYGGDEFFVVLPKVAPDVGKQISNSIRRKLERLDIRPNRNVTASFGVAASRQNENAEELVSRADQSAYQSKRSGKNRVTAEFLEIDMVFEDNKEKNRTTQM